MLATNAADDEAMRLFRPAALGFAILVATTVGASAAPRTIGATHHVAASASPTAPTTWGLIGDDTNTAPAEAADGVTAKVVRISWSDFETAPGVFSTAYEVSKQAEISSLKSQGMGIILDLGLQGTPQWIHQYANSYLVDQYGERWTDTTNPGQTVDDSDANLIFNPALRAIASAYIVRVGQDFGSGAAAIRVGGGRDGELDYPPATTPSHTNDYWAFDALAQAQSPVPGWKPGDASPNGQAQQFLTWYLNSLVRFEQWQVATLRSAYSGPIIILFPGWGIRPGQTAAATADNLDGASGAESTGEIPRGDDFAAQIAAISQAKVWVETTWLDAAEYGSDASADPDLWTPVHYLASLAAASSYHPEMWGENTGEGSAATLSWTISQACTYGLQGVVWFNENELLSGKYATLAQYAAAVSHACNGQAADFRSRSRRDQLGRFRARAAAAS